MKHASGFIVLALLAACAPAPAPEAPAVAAAPSPYAFEIDLTLTPRAAEKLASTHERVVVDAMYFGVPVRPDAPGVDEHGMEVGLGADAIEIDPANTLVKAPGTGFDGANIASITGEPEVLVNVYSARKTHTDNLLNCGIYQGPVAMAQKKPVEIQCDLIYDENGEPIVGAPEAPPT